MVKLFLYIYNGPLRNKAEAVFSEFWKTRCHLTAFGLKYN